MKHVGQLVDHDPIWDTICDAAASLAAEEPILGSLAHASVLNQSCFEYALSYILAQRLGSEDVPAMLLRQVFDAITVDDSEIGIAARADLVAVCEREVHVAEEDANRRNVADRHAFHAQPLKNEHFLS